MAEGPGYKAQAVERAGVRLVDRNGHGASGQFYLHSDRIASRVADGV